MARDDADGEGKDDKVDTGNKMDITEGETVGVDIHVATSGDGLMDTATDEGIDNATYEGVDTSRGEGGDTTMGESEAATSETVTTDYPHKSTDPTIIPLSDTIRLSYCKSSECGCKSVHCPFCDKSHFKPAKPSRVRDHLELKHFAHSVKYDDMIIVKCFRDCGDKPKGHYHCPNCPKQLLKRNAFHSHLVKHVKNMKKSPDLVTAPDDKLPSKIVFQGDTLQLCIENCDTSLQEHFHCQYCDQIFVDRSMLITHMWRCQTGKINEYANTKLGQELDQLRADNSISANCSHPKDVPDIKWHVSIVRSVADIPVEKCEDSSSEFGGYYHCALCPVHKFKPTTEDHLQAHYNLHWKKRIPYKDYYILICYQPCQGTEEDVTQSNYHYHCPVCGECRKRRNCFLHHLRICKGNRESTHRFAVTKNKDKNEDEEFLHEAEVAVESLTNMEAVVLTDSSIETPAIGEVAERECVVREEDILPDPLAVEQAPVIVENFPENAETCEDISSIDVYEKVTATLSRKLIEAFDQTTMDDIISKMAMQMDLSVGWSPGISSPQYTLSGRLEDIVQAKHQLYKCILKVHSPETDSVELFRKDESQEVSKDDETNTDSLAMIGQKTENEQDVNMENAVNSKSLPMKRKRGRAKKTSKLQQTQKNSYLSKESCVERNLLNQSIDSMDHIQLPVKSETGSSAEKQPITGKRKANSQNIDEKPNIHVDSVSTVSSKRYSTRGKRLDFSAMVNGRKGSSEDNSNLSKKNDITDRNTQARSKEFLPQTDKKSSVDLTLLEKNTTTKLTDADSVLTAIGNPEPNLPVDKRNKGDSEDIYSNVDEEIDEMMIIQKSASTPLTKRRGDNIAHIPAIVFEDSIKLGRKSLGFSYTNRNDSDMQITSDGQYLENEIQVNVAGEDFGDDGGVRDKCNLCDFIPDSFTSLQHHLLDIHQTHCPFRCDICEVIFQDESALENHLHRRHQPFKQVQKSIINPEVKRKSEFEKNPNRKEYRCLKCDFKTFRLNCLYAHREFIHNDTPVCEHCGKTFARFMHMQTHIQAVHTKSKSAVCHICGKNFDHVRYMKAHMKRHSDSKDYACEICNKRFTERTTLKGHMEIHKKPEERSYRYVCDFCGKRFLNKNTYSDHLNKHTGEKPYSCDKCNQKFTFKSVLDKHKLFKHTTVKPFPCPICRKAFKMQRLLNQHLVTHTGHSDFVCEECGRSFSCKNTLKNHKPKCKGVVLRQKSGSNVILVLAEQGMNQSEQVSLSNAVMSLDPQSSNMEATQILTPDGIVQLESAQVTDSSMTEESEPALYICSECNAVFETFQEVETHVLMGHSDGSVKDSGILQPQPLVDNTISTSGSDATSTHPIIDIQNGSSMYISEVEASALVNLGVKDHQSI
ncbi:uncharacterized protein LOC132548677 [Ylistrum balloti]|uniref:uncharacterized protein LOC132548677 n=1 Tax=Ylistrum balloti TaxID=509963 RepID=UPI00290587FF|nr:uncharacterized protein LOC132548677 [Ylistrum balloti]